MIEFTIEKPARSDLPEILALIYPEYFNESYVSEGLTYDEESTKALIGSCIDAVSFVARSEGKIIAFCCMGFYRTFYKELLGEVYLFFVSPKGRGSKISRTFCESLLAEAEKNGVKKITVSASSKNKLNNKKIENLWKKYGFEVVGLTMVRS